MQDIFAGKTLALPNEKENVKKKSSYSKLNDERGMYSDSDDETDPRPGESSC